MFVPVKNTEKSNNPTTEKDEQIYKEAIFDDSIHLSTENNSFKETKTKGRILESQIHPKSLAKIWSSASVFIKSNQPCTVYESSNITEIKNKRGDFFMSVYRFLSRLKSDEDHNKCDQYHYVQLFKKTYFLIETSDADLEVGYEFVAIDPMMVGCSLAGLFLFCISDKLTRNIGFYYFSGISIGLIGSFLILIFMITKLIPKKSAALATFFTGTSAFMFLARWTLYNFLQLTESSKLYIFTYFAISATISFVFVYTQGPVTNPKYLDVIDGALKIFSLGLIYASVSYKEIFFAFLIGFTVVTLLFKIRNTNLMNKLINMLSCKFFQKKRKLLTQEEYNQEADDYTQKALRDLQKYCQSPECNSWRIISRLQSPDKFARFVQQQESHVSDEETSFYERYNISNDLIDDDE